LILGHGTHRVYLFHVPCARKHNIVECVMNVLILTKPISRFRLSTSPKPSNHLALQYIAESNTGGWSIELPRPIACKKVLYTFRFFEILVMQFLLPCNTSQMRGALSYFTSQVWKMLVNIFRKLCCIVAYGLLERHFEYVWLVRWRCDLIGALICGRRFLAFLGLAQRVQK
jgi:hypothetical protein